MTSLSATVMVARYRAGELTLDELAADFAAREWHESSWREEHDALDWARRFNEADGRDRNEAGTWGEVVFLYRTDELTPDEFYTLLDAVDAANGIDEFGNDIAVGVDGH